MKLSSILLLLLVSLFCAGCNPWLIGLLVSEKDTVEEVVEDVGDSLGDMDEVFLGEKFDPEEEPNLNETKNNVCTLFLNIEDGDNLGSESSSDIFLRELIEKNGFEDQNYLRLADFNFEKMKLDHKVRDKYPNYQTNIKLDQNKLIVELSTDGSSYPVVDGEQHGAIVFDFDSDTINIYETGDLSTFVKERNHDNYEFKVDSRGYNCLTESDSCVEGLVEEAIPSLRSQNCTRSQHSLMAESTFSAVGSLNALEGDGSEGSSDASSEAEEVILVTLPDTYEINISALDANCIMSGVITNCEQVNIEVSDGVNDTSDYAIEYFFEAGCPIGSADGSAPESLNPSLSLTSDPLTIGINSFSFLFYDSFGNSECVNKEIYKMTAGTPFISTWTTSTENETITLPLREGEDYNYDFIVDWGDESTSEITSFNDADISHSYSTPGTHTITIAGNLEAWYFNGSSDAQKITSVASFGTMGWIDLTRAFSGCSNLVSFSSKGVDGTNISNMNYMFSGTSSLSSIAFPDVFDARNIADMSGLFYNSGLTNLDLSNWEIRDVLNMEMMFAESENLQSITFPGSFDAKLVTNMKQMFYQTGLTSLDLSNWEIRDVENMEMMFAESENLQFITFPGTFDAKLATNMKQMFYQTGLTSLDLSSWQAQNVLDMESMFNSTTALETLTFPSVFDLKKLITAENMFKDSRVASLNLSNWEIDVLDNVQGMFSGNSNLATLDVMGWDTSSVTSSSNIFSGTNSNLIVFL